MRRTKIAGAVGAVMVLGAALVAPVLPASAGQVLDPQVMTVTKVVTGNTDVATFPVTLSCAYSGPGSVPADTVGPLELVDGVAQTVEETDLGVVFASGVSCTVGEAIDGDLPNEVTVLVSSSEGDLLAVETIDPPGIGFDFEFAFDTIPDAPLSYEILVINDYSDAGTADQMCSYVETQVGLLTNLIDSMGDIEALTPEQIMQVWEATENLFLDALLFLPPDVADAWVDVTVAYIQVGDILAGVGFDVDLLTLGDVSEIEAIFAAVDAQFETIGLYLALNCIAWPAPPPPPAAVVTAPAYTG